MTKSVRMLNNGTNMLDEILMVGKQARDSTRIGFKMNYDSKTPKTNFVPTQQKPDFRVMWTHPTPLQKPAHKGKFTAWKCHYCGKNGHIKAFCYKLFGYPKKKPQAKTHHVKTKPKKEWKPKDVVSNPLSFPTKVVVDSVVEIIQEDPHIEYEYESTSEDEKCQSMVTNHGEEEKTVGDKNTNFASVGNVKFASDGKDQRLSDGGKSECASEEDDDPKNGKRVSEKD
ncbi:hypothetical protein P8452_47343 [Trifolium repens]|nr:hypothetical protein P8452_47343 [Trifolium repens]